MPTTLSGQRIARSFVTPTGGSPNEVSRELDFQLSQDEGIRINAVLGYGQFYDNTPTVSDTVPAHAFAHQALHLETGATETLPADEGQDADDIDTEIFYVQTYSSMFQTGSTNTFGAGGSMVVLPSGLLVFPTPILSPRNITHKGATIEADTFLNAGVLIFFEYVRFSQAELGGILARQN